MAGRVSRSSPSPESADSGRTHVPNTLSDPVWSLQPWSISVRLGGHQFEVPALPAVAYLTVLMSPEADLFDVFPGLLSTEASDLVSDLLLDETVDMEEMNQVNLDIISAVSGRPWWVALRLIEVGRVSWPTLGAKMLSRGVDAAHLSLSGWLDVLLLTIMENIEPKEATMFTMKLEQVPPEEQASQPEPEMSASSFMSMA